MGQRKNPPLLRVGSLSGRVTIITRYHRTKQGLANNFITADEQHEISDEEFELVVKEWRKEKRWERRRKGGQEA